MNNKVLLYSCLVRSNLIITLSCYTIYVRNDAHSQERYVITSEVRCVNFGYLQFTGFFEEAIFRTVSFGRSIRVSGKNC